MHRRVIRSHVVKIESVLCTITEHHGVSCVNIVELSPRSSLFIESQKLIHLRFEEIQAEIMRSPAPITKQPELVETDRLYFLFDPLNLMQLFNSSEE